MGERERWGGGGGGSSYFFFLLFFFFLFFIGPSENSNFHGSAIHRRCFIDFFFFFFPERMIHRFFENDDKNATMRQGRCKSYRETRKRITRVFIRKLRRFLPTFLLSSFRNTPYHIFFMELKRLYVTITFINRFDMDKVRTRIERKIVVRSAINKFEILRVNSCTYIHSRESSG